jgi:hypothetical protein
MSAASLMMASNNNSLLSTTLNCTDAQIEATAAEYKARTKKDITLTQIAERYECPFTSTFKVTVPCNFLYVEAEVSGRTELEYTIDISGG